MLKIIQGNIFKLKIDAIINPANVSLLAGGGLCGAIHKMAGRELEQLCKTIGKQEYGNAVITPSFALTNCGYIIHACGPKWLDGKRNEPKLLAKTHQSIIEIARLHNLKSIAIPAISTGIYRFPADVAAQIAISSVVAETKGLELDVTFVVNEPDKFEIYKKALKDVNEIN
ncbi:MAG: macro domain-containing protein [Gammaproteobacteria bacterium]|nr:macro domain-containing protein [Gammaproteobacteria bacterium]